MLGGLFVNVLRLQWVQIALGLRADIFEAENVFCLELFDPVLSG